MRGVVAPQDVIRGVAQLGRALEWGSRGHRFKSCRPELNLTSGQLME